MIQLNIGNQEMFEIQIEEMPFILTSFKKKISLFDQIVWNLSPGKNRIK